MSNESNESLLPQIFENSLELDLSGPKISLKEFEINTGKSVSELGEVITERLCSLPAVQAKTIWTALDEASKNELTYHDLGTFNLYLIEKLNIPGKELHRAFTSNLARQIFELDNAPLSTPQYSRAYLTIQSELLSTCRQLYSAKSRGKERLKEFLESFDMDFLALVVRHEIARYYVDEKGTELDWDIAELENGVEYVEKSESNVDLLEEPETFDEREVEKSEIEEFKQIFFNGYNIPPVLEFTHWIQNFAPGFYLNIRNLILFLSKEQGISIWERTNPLEPEPDGYEERIKEAENDMIAGRLSSRHGRQEGLVSVDSEKEERRLIRIYTIYHPLKNDYRKIYLQLWNEQAIIATRIIMESGRDTSKIQTFEQFRRTVWELIGFTRLQQWIDRQDDPKRLLESSGKMPLFDEMKVLGAGAFNVILAESLEASKALTFKLYGWFCLVKIFWNITKIKKRFLDLATVKNDTIVWEEKVTVNTLIFQAILNSDQMFFTLNEVNQFCEATRQPGWSETLKQSFEDLARSNDAVSAIPTFHSQIDFVQEKAKNLFVLADEILLAKKDEKEIVQQVKALVIEHYDAFIGSLFEGQKKTEQEIKQGIEISFLFKLSFIKGYQKFSEQAHDFLAIQLGKIDISNYVENFDFPEVDMPDDLEDSEEEDPDPEMAKFLGILKRAKKPPPDSDEADA
jgi:hypothetical protein